MFSLDPACLDESSENLNRCAASICLCFCLKPAAILDADPLNEDHIQLDQRTLSLRAWSEGALDPEKRVARGDRDIGSGKLIDLDQASGARMTFDGPLSRGDRYEEYHHQASVVGYRGF